MVTATCKYGLSVLLVILTLQGIPQAHLFSEVELNKTAVYQGEPAEVRVSVFTSTWFTKGVDPGNIKVDGAYTVYFRSVSESKRIGGKTYAGVTMIYNVFPYESNDVVFPSVNFQVETPDDGSSKGVSRTVTTQPKTIKVKPVPAGFDGSQWVVTQNIAVNESWSHSLRKIKVGDVVERTVTRTVANNVAGLIPPLAWDTISGVSTYVGRSDVKDNRTRTSISARRTDGITYLFEKEGEVVIPAMEISWWNPVQNKAFKRTLKETTIQVMPNPDLGMLESIRDSLNVAETSMRQEETEDVPLTILGLPVTQLLGVALAAVLCILILLLVLKKLLRFLKKRREAYRNSEKYYFQQIFRGTLNSRNLNAVYQWIDQLMIPEPTLECFIELHGTNELAEDAHLLLNSSENRRKLNKAAWKKARGNYLAARSVKQMSAKKLWVNPSASHSS